MADTDARVKIAGSEYWLMIDPDNGTNYSNLVCITDHNLSGSNATNSSTTYCGSFSAPGDQTQSLGFNGLIVKDPETGEISAPDLFTLFQNRTPFAWKYGALIPTAGDITKTGHGYFSAYGENFSASDFGKMSGTIAVDGPITQTIEVGS